MGSSWSTITFYETSFLLSIPIFSGNCKLNHQSKFDQDRN